MVNGQNVKIFLHQQFTIHYCPFTIQNSPFTIHHSQFTIRYPSALKISLKIFPADNSSMSLS
jgi:hypothetical protein